MNRVKCYEFNHFKMAGGLVHRVFSRHGGVSRKPFDSLNVGNSIGDDPSAVRENRQRVQKELGADYTLYLNQVHGCDVLSARNGLDLSRIYNVDAVITDIRGLALMIQVADCQSIMIYDPKVKVIANIHSGWRSSIRNIIGKTVDQMILEFGCQVANLLVGISPSLGPCCAEFIHYREEFPYHLWKYRHPGRFHFNFWSISRDQLMEKGVKKSAIEIMKICTCCASDRFFSYRAEKKTGRFVCGLLLL